MLRCLLTVVDPRGRSLSVPLTALPLVVGREVGCDVRPDDIEVSRRHAQLVFTGAECIVTDLGSLNGTLVNGERVRQCAVTPGDRLQMGQTQFWLSLIEAAAPAQASPGRAELEPPKPGREPSRRESVARRQGPSAPAEHAAPAPWFFRACLWLAQHRVLAFTSGLITPFSFPWLMAAMGTSVRTAQGAPNVVYAWGGSQYETPLRIANGLSFLAIPACLVVAIYLQLMGPPWMMALIPLSVVTYAATYAGVIELWTTLRTGEDSFALAARYVLGAPLQPAGPMSLRLARATEQWSPGARMTTGVLWAFAAGNAMLFMAMVILGGAVAIALLWAVIAILAIFSPDDSPGRPPRGEYIPPSRREPIRIKEGRGGLFAEVVATIDGNRILEGEGGMLARVLATIDGNRILEGEGGLFARVLATRVGDEIREGDGGWTARVLGRIEGDRIVSNQPWLLAEVLYTIE